MKIMKSIVNNFRQMCIFYMVSLVNVKTFLKFVFWIFIYWIIIIRLNTASNNWWIISYAFVGCFRWLLHNSSEPCCDHCGIWRGRRVRFLVDKKFIWNKLGWPGIYQIEAQYSWPKRQVWYCDVDILSEEAGRSKVKYITFYWKMMSVDAPIE